ncbi:MAG: class I SAM-dependent methyltransferase [Gammaproteobacteria bacterium]
MCDGDAALLELGISLRAVGYHFITVSPETHRRVITRCAPAEASSLRDVFGWSRWFRKSLLPVPMLSLLDEAGALEHNGTLLRSKVRYSSLDDALYVHSAYPTVAAEAVFFGPDSYRFAALIRRVISAAVRTPIRCAVDIGCGTGVGGIVLAKVLHDQPRRLVLADINTQALRYAHINAALAKIKRYECVESDVLQAVDGPVDLIMANPPYLLDAGSRLYRHGGGQWGYDLSLRIVRESLPRLAPGGKLILYTGAAIVDGKDVFRQAIQPELAAAGMRYDYAEIDPDVFGDELEYPGYSAVERIAAVSLIVEA